MVNEHLNAAIAENEKNLMKLEELFKCPTDYFYELWAAGKLSRESTVFQGWAMLHEAQNLLLATRPSPTPPTTG